MVCIKACCGATKYIPSVQPCLIASSFIAGISMPISCIFDISCGKVIVTSGTTGGIGVTAVGVTAVPCRFFQVPSFLKTFVEACKASFHSMPLMSVIGGAGASTTGGAGASTTGGAGASTTGEPFKSRLSKRVATCWTSFNVFNLTVNSYIFYVPFLKLVG